MTWWFCLYFGIGAVCALVSMVGGINAPWHVRACIYVGVVALWPLVNAVELAGVVQRAKAEGGGNGAECSTCGYAPCMCDQQ